MNCVSIIHSKDNTTHGRKKHPLIASGGRGSWNEQKKCCTDLSRERLDTTVCLSTGPPSPLPPKNNTVPSNLVCVLQEELTQIILSIWKDEPESCTVRYGHRIQFQPAHCLLNDQIQTRSCDHH